MTDPAPTPARPARERLPNRRQHELLSFEHQGIRYTAGIGRFPDGRIAEVFLNASKTGTGIETASRDAAIGASRLLQYGCPVDDLRRALTRNSDGSASGALGVLLDLLATEAAPGQPAGEQHTDGGENG